jgi:hypothetical protein
MATEKQWFLTSPHMKGTGIRDLQKELKRKGYLQGAVDGEFGPDTHRAVFRAKHHLGYLRPDHKAGAKLYAFLKGTRPLTPQMKALAARRKPKPLIYTKGYLKLQEACKHLGATERPPNSNRTIFSIWYGMIGAWCAMFCTFCGVKVGLKSYKKGERWAYVPFQVSDARQGKYRYAITYRPVSGDDVAFDWNPPGVADHVGIYAEERHLKLLVPVAFAAAKRQFGPLGTKEFWTVEGNTGIGNDSNGGKCMIRKRSRTNVVAFMHPGG